MSTQKQDTCLPPKRYYQFAILKPRPTYRIHRKKKHCNRSTHTKEESSNPVYNPDSKSLPASVVGTRFVTFKRGDGSALVHPPGTLPSSTPMTRSSPP